MKNGFTAACESILRRMGHALEHHPKQATAVIAALLLGAGGTAFGVATLDPAPEAIAIRQVLEDVAPLAIDSQLRELEQHDLSLYRSDTTRGNESVEALLARLGVDDAAAASFLRREPTFRRQMLGRQGRSISVESNERRELVKLIARWTPDASGYFKRLVVERAADGVFVSHTETPPLVASVRLGSAVVRTSLFGAADDAHVPDPVVTQMVELFSGEIDFHRDLRMGDRFDVVYETLEADGEAVRTGRVLSAEFVNAGTRYNAVWFQPVGRKGGYYTLDGRSLANSYVPPLEFSRVSSGFAVRFHPLRHEWKAHLGVDYAAPTGTPVRSVADGTVEFAGVQGGFGNVVIVRHNNRDQTVYAHLSRIGVRRGQSVAQGQNVGNVGSTGWSTGPHLHFEFRVNGAHQNPALLAKRNDAVKISADQRPEFERLVHFTRIQLAAAARALQVASAN